MKEQTSGTVRRGDAYMRFADNRVVLSGSENKMNITLGIETLSNILYQ